MNTKTIPIENTDFLNIKSQLISARCPLICLDYDGTLVGVVKDIQKPAPPPKVIKLLDLMVQKGIHIAIVTGRSQRQVRQWFEDKPYHLIAEHGAWYKQKDEQWEEIEGLQYDWKKEFIPLLESHTKKNPHSVIEDKKQGIGWHYRNCSSEVDEAVISLKNTLTSMLSLRSKKDIELLEGKKAIEIKNAFVNKGKAIEKLYQFLQADWVMAIGDDDTDEHMFRVLQNRGITIKVSTETMPTTLATYSLKNHEEVLAFLENLI